MSQVTSYVCRLCDGRHDGPPLAYGFEAPVYWHDGLAGVDGSVLGEEQCVIDGDGFFVRAVLPIDVTDTGTTFEWGVWVSLSAASFEHMSETWMDPARVGTPPYFGWLSSVIPLYEPTTLNLKTRVHMRDVGVRPVIELEPTSHPLAVEQRTGITRARVQELAENLLHQQ